MISLLFAMDENRVIGYENGLPWQLPNDLKFFKELTTSQTVIMGRKTFESMNGPLPNRENIVLTQNNQFEAEGCTVIHSIEDVVKWNKENPSKEYFVIGGEEIFKLILPDADRIYMTLIKASFKGDTFFPHFDETKWQLTKETKGEKNERNPYDYFFRQYDQL